MSKWGSLYLRFEKSSNQIPSLGRDRKRKWKKGAEKVKEVTCVEGSHM